MPFVSWRKPVEINQSMYFWSTVTKQSKPKIIEAVHTTIKGTYRDRYFWSKEGSRSEMSNVVKHSLPRLAVPILASSFFHAIGLHYPVAFGRPKYGKLCSVQYNFSSSNGKIVLNNNQNPIEWTTLRKMEHISTMMEATALWSPKFSLPSLKFSIPSSRFPFS